MAKNQTSTQGSNGGKKGGNGAGATKDRTKMISDSEGGRKTKRNERQAAERRRLEQVQSGTFYTNLNEGRSSDIAAAVTGQVGIYAYPGGNKPSLHFNVQNETGRLGTMPVVRFEAVQRGHELEGGVFNRDTYLPCFYIEKFGADFRSRSQNRLAATTQELICLYLTTQLHTRKEEVTQAPTISIEEVYEKSKGSQEDLRAMLEGVIGTYGIKADKGIVILKGYQRYGKARLSVHMSSVQGVVEGSYYLPTHLVKQPSLDKVTDEDTYSNQFSLFLFLRENLSELLTQPAPPEKVMLNASGRPMGKKELAKQGRKKAMAIAEAGQRATEATILASMRKNTVSLRDAVMAGTMGHVDLSGTAGDLIVCFGMIDADKTIMVAHMAKTHVLRIAGVDEGLSIFVGQLMRGEVDSHEAKFMTGDAKTARNALITFIRSQLTANGFKLRTPSLHLVKKAA
jgi:hypothetical protein